jgi:hypothetical protein
MPCGNAIPVSLGTKAGSKRVAELELQFWRAVQTEMRGLVARRGEPDPTGLLGQLCEAQQRMEGAVLEKLHARRGRESSCDTGMYMIAALMLL